MDFGRQWRRRVGGARSKRERPQLVLRLDRRDAGRGCRTDRGVSAGPRRRDARAQQPPAAVASAGGRSATAADRRLARRCRHRSHAACRQDRRAVPRTGGVASLGKNRGLRHPDVGRSRRHLAPGTRGPRRRGRPLRSRHARLCRQRSPRRALGVDRGGLRACGGTGRHSQAGPRHGRAGHGRGCAAPLRCGDAPVLRRRWCLRAGRRARHRPEHSPCGHRKRASEHLRRQLRARRHQCGARRRPRPVGGRRRPRHPRHRHHRRQRRCRGALRRHGPAGAPHPFREGAWTHQFDHRRGHRPRHRLSRRSVVLRRRGGQALGREHEPGPRRPGLGRAHGGRTQAGRHRVAASPALRRLGWQLRLPWARRLRFREECADGRRGDPGRRHRQLQQPRPDAGRALAAADRRHRRAARLRRRQWFPPRLRGIQRHQHVLASGGWRRRAVDGRGARVPRAAGGGARPAHRQRHQARRLPRRHRQVPAARRRRPWRTAEPVRSRQGLGAHQRAEPGFGGRLDDRQRDAGARRRRIRLSRHRRARGRKPPGHRLDLGRTAGGHAGTADAERSRPVGGQGRRLPRDATGGVRQRGLSLQPRQRRVAHPAQSDRRPLSLEGGAEVRAGADAPCGAGVDDHPRPVDAPAFRCRRRR